MTMTIDHITDKLETIVQRLESDTDERIAALMDLFDITDDLSEHTVQLRKVMDSYTRWRQNRQLCQVEGISLIGSDHVGIKLLEQFAAISNEMLKKVNAP